MAPLEVTDYSLREWPNLNNKPSSDMSTAEETTSQNSNLATSLAAPRTPSIHRDPLSSFALTDSADRNPFSSAYTQQAGPSKASNQNENPPTQIETNPLRYVFKTPPPRSLSFGLANTERRPTYTPSSKTSVETAPDSTITKIRKDFRTSLAHFSQVHSRLARENGEHAMRADAIMRDMDEMRKGLLETQAEGRQNQGRLEASMASLNNLIKQRENQADTRMAEMSAVMKERHRQADERLKLMTDLMQRRETETDARMIDLMTTMKDLTLGVRAMASQTVAAQAKAAPAAPIAPHPSDLPSTSAVPPPLQATYRKVALPSVEQTKPLKLIPPATYKRDPPKTSKLARISQTESRDVGTDPLSSISFDPCAHGASTTGDYYSSASGMTTRESNYHTARTAAATTCTIKATTSKSVFQLRRPIAPCNRLPTKSSRKKADTTTSQLLLHKPIRRMDLPISTTRNK